jgi:Cytidylyltransferase-like
VLDLDSLLEVCRVETAAPAPDWTDSVCIGCGAADFFFGLDNTSSSVILYWLLWLLWNWRRIWSFGKGRWRRKQQSTVLSSFGKTGSNGRQAQMTNSETSSSYEFPSQLLVKSYHGEDGVDAGGWKAYVVDFFIFFRILNTIDWLFSSIFRRDTFRTSESIQQSQNIVLVACGSFNPITNLHLRLFESAKDFLTHEKCVNVLGGFISPVHDEYGKRKAAGLADGQHRLEMCRAAVASSDWIAVDSWEVQQPTYSRTRQVLSHFSDSVSKYYA